MPEGFDVAALLATGEPSVERIGTYVWACRQLGYQHPDLTAHAAQVRDWYARDDGLDLTALDADCAAMSAAAAAADDAVRRHGELSAELAGAWSGGGAGAAREFLWRHGQSAVTVRDGLRRAADALATLRDELWRAVDQKVEAVRDIDDRSLPQRAEWLAAAQTVTAGAGDRAAASELVDQQIKPFVDNDIRSDWLAAIHRATASTTAAYDAAIVRIDSGEATTFDVPGELGPRWGGQGSPPAPVAADGVAALPGATVPAAAVISSPPSYDPPAAAPAAAPAQTPFADPSAAAPAMAPAASMPSLGEMGGGMPSLGSGASGFGQQLADLIGGLVGSGASEATGEGTSEDALPDEPELDPADEVDKPDELDEDPETKPADAADETGEEPTDEELTEEPEPALQEPEPPEPVVTPVPPEPEPPIPPAAAEAMPAEKTPCEIAADELPQVGE
jgi:hypothetical protein